MNRRASLLFTAALLFQQVAISRADPVNLEGGFRVAYHFPTGTGLDPPFGGLGFMGQLNYEIENWGFGARGYGIVTLDTPLTISAGEFHLQGRLARRQYGLELLARYFFHDSAGRKRWYLELGFLGIQTDFIDAEDVYTVPDSTDYTRLFLVGGGFSLGLGYRPIQGPWFFQFNYELDHYENLQITASVNHLHPVVAEAPLNANYFIHTVSFMFGINVFGR